MDLSVIIVNWRSKNYLDACLKSIFANVQGSGFEVIVIDNASFDGAGELLEQHFPEVVFIQSSKNLGFAGANNAAFTRSQGRNILFLNPDTEIEGPAIGLMMKALDTQPSAGIVGARLLNSDGSLQTSCVQSFPTLWNQALDTEFLRNLFPTSSLWGTQALGQSTETPMEVEVISGACLMVKREAFEKVGQFSTDYFMYSEDVDLCHKVQRAGWKNYYAGEARVIHHGGRSSSASPQSSFAVVMTRESQLRYMRLRRGRVYAALYRVTTALAALGRLSMLGLGFGLTLGRFRRGSFSSAMAKWASVLRWTLGLSAWVKTAGN